MGIVAVRQAQTGDAADAESPASAAPRGSDAIDPLTRSGAAADA